MLLGVKHEAIQNEAVPPKKTILRGNTAGLSGSMKIAEECQGEEVAGLGLQH